MQLGAVSSLFLLFQTYQDKTAAGKTYYTFLLLGLMSGVDIRVLYYVPVFWVLMAWLIYSLSWRTFFASLLGLLTPYWFALPWFAYREDFDSIIHHMANLVDISSRIDFTSLSLPQFLFLGFLLLLAIIGALHFVLTSYLDKIRVRQLYYSFILITVFSTLLLFLMPQCYDMVIGMMIVTVSPLYAHFVALTHTRLSNIVFIVITAMILILTGFNLWIS